MIVTTTQEHISRIPAARKFRAAVVESHHVLPLAMPKAIHRVEVEDDIRETHFFERGVVKRMKHRIDVVDNINYVHKYTLVEGDLLAKFERVVHEVRYEALGNGCVVKVTNHYHPRPGVTLDVGEIEAGEVTAMGLYKDLEEYLSANEHVCRLK